MQVIASLQGLRPCLPEPSGVAGLARRDPAGSCRRRVENGPVESRADDVVVGQVRPSLNTLTLAEPDANVAFDRRGILNGTRHD